MKHILESEFAKLPDNVRGPLVDRFNDHLRKMVARYNYSLRDGDIEVDAHEIIAPLASILNLAKDMTEKLEKKS